MIKIGILTLIVSAFTATFGANAQTYPAKPIRLIVPLQPGGLADGFARLLGQHFTDRMGQPVVVENRPGGSQVIAAEATARSAPDGYTLMLATEAGLVLATLAQKQLPYDPIRDFSPISMLFIVPYYLMVHTSLPASNLQELIAHAKANPGKLSYASFGQGTGNHIGGEILNKRFGIDMVHVPYKGTAQAMTDLLAGQVQVMFGGGQTSIPTIKSGKVRGIGVSGIKRSGALPDLPTVAEQGVPGFDIIAWFSLLGPAGLPRSMVDKLNTETLALLKSPGVRDKYLSFGIDMNPSTPQELADHIRNGPAYWAKILAETGIKLE
ncbi:MAG: Bug family tripartite tricarboxylate transporter substrate binding protein [Burkholderiales bacterium]